MRSLKIEIALWSIDFIGGIVVGLSIAHYFQ